MTQFIAVVIEAFKRSSGVPHTEAPDGVGYAMLITGPNQRELVLSGSFGDEQATLEKPFFAASVTKMFTTRAVLAALHARGLNRNAVVSDWIPEAAILRSGTTFSELINHLSGLDEYSENVPLFQSFDNSLSLEDAALRTLEAASLGNRGVYRYSNTGYLALGLALERLSGTTASKAIASLVLVPNRLTSSRIWDAAEADPPAEAWRYTGQWTKLMASRKGVGWTDGALMTTLGDLSSWAQVIAREPRIEPPAKGSIYRDGLVWEQSKNFGPIAWHSGSGYGVRSLFLFAPEQAASLVLFGNFEAPGLEDVVETLQSAVLD